MSDNNSTPSSSGTSLYAESTSYPVIGALTPKQTAVNELAKKVLDNNEQGMNIVNRCFDVFENEGGSQRPNSVSRNATNVPSIRQQVTSDGASAQGPSSQAFPPPPPYSSLAATSVKTANSETVRIARVRLLSDPTENKSVQGTSIDYARDESGAHSVSDAHSISMKGQLTRESSLRDTSSLKHQSTSNPDPSTRIEKRKVQRESIEKINELDQITALIDNPISTKADEEAMHTTGYSASAALPSASALRRPTELVSINELNGLLEKATQFDTPHGINELRRQGDVKHEKRDAARQIKRVSIEQRRLRGEKGQRKELVPSNEVKNGEKNEEENEEKKSTGCNDDDVVIASIVDDEQPTEQQPNFKGGRWPAIPPGHKKCRTKNGPLNCPYTVLVNAMDCGIQKHSLCGTCAALRADSIFIIDDERMCCPSGNCTRPVRIDRVKEEYADETEYCKKIDNALDYWKEHPSQRKSSKLSRR